MKTPLLTTATLCTLLFATAAQAGHDCEDPVFEWQPRDTLREQLEAKGWKVRRIKVDDGCYKIKGLDQHGNKIEADYSPASLILRKLRIEFEENAVIPDSLYSGDR